MRYLVVGSPVTGETVSLYDDPETSDARKKIAESGEPRSILQEADAIAGKDRSRDYGHPMVNHQRIADIWNVQLAGKLADGTLLSPRDVAVMMIGLKLARLINSPNHHDSMVDIAGYVKCWDMIRKEEEFQLGKQELQPGD